jgi:hypothetical protein
MAFCFSVDSLESVLSEEGEYILHFYLEVIFSPNILAVVMHLSNKVTQTADWSKG